MNEKEILDRIYPSVTTWLVDWRKLVAEVKYYKLDKISLFLTGVNFSERQEVYRLLEQTSVKAIPHVHLRNDMRESEINYLVKRYRTKAFTTHFQYYRNFSKSKHIKNIFLETNRGPGLIKNLKPFARVGGVCVDLSHMAMFKTASPEAWAMAEKAITEFKVGCNHISGILPNGRSWHAVKNIQDLDYLKDLPKKYFSRYLCLEVQNPIKEQLRFKKYVAKILYKVWK